MAWKLWRLPIPGWTQIRYRLSEEGFTEPEIDSHLRTEHIKFRAQGRFPITNNYGPGCYGADPGLRGSFDARSLDEFLGPDEDTWSVKQNLTDAFIQQVKKDEHAVEVRIQMQFPEVYNEIDRLRAEGQLRLSIFWPGMIASSTHAILWSPWFLILIAPLIGLMMDGRRRVGQASEKTRSCLIAGKVSSSLLDEVHSANEREATPIDALKEILWNPHDEHASDEYDHEEG